MAKRTLPDDTSYLHGAALRRGLDTILLPNRVLLICPNKPQATMCFARGFPTSTAQGIAAMLEEQDVTRQYLRDQGIPVPASRTFSFSDSIDLVEAEADAIGYPITLRPAWRYGRSCQVSSSHELRDSVKVIQQAAGRLSKRAGRPQSRFMVEEEIGRSSAVVLVSHDEVLFAGESLGQSTASSSDVSDDFCQLAVNAVRSLPDIQLGSIQIVAENVSKEAESQKHGVAWLGPEPRLNLCNRAGPGLGVQLAGQIIDRESGQSSENSGWNGDREISMIFSGVSMQDSATSSLKAFLSHKGVVLRSSRWIRDGEFAFAVYGSTNIVADIADDIMRGRVPGMLPLRTEVRQVLTS